MEKDSEKIVCSTARLPEQVAIEKTRGKKSGTFARSHFLSVKCITLNARGCSRALVWKGGGQRQPPSVSLHCIRYCYCVYSKHVYLVAAEQLKYFWLFLSRNCLFLSQKRNRSILHEKYEKTRLDNLHRFSI